MPPRMYKGIRIPDNDPERVEALKAYQIMDTPREVEYDDLIELARQICGVKMAHIAFIDGTRQWLKAHSGRPPGAPTEAERQLASCHPTILQQDLMVVPDMSKHELYCNAPAVTGPPHNRLYCAMPLVTPEGFVLGTFCVQDPNARELPPEQSQWVRRLAGQVMKLLELRRKTVELEAAQEALRAAQQALKQEKEQAEGLLHNILPPQIAAELKRNQRVEPRYYQQVTILFADIKDFTHFAESVEPKTLVSQLDAHFTAFDEIMHNYSVEKLKTIGDNYMAVAGLPVETRTHATTACLAALAMQQAVTDLNAKREQLGLEPWSVRVGLHSGPVMAGMVGRSKFTFDVWGDAVNIASRMESAGEAGRIQISENTYGQVSRFFECEPRGKVELKGKGAVQAYFLNRVKPELSEDADGTCANDEFFSRAGY